MTIELQNQAKVSINTNEIKEIQFTEGKIVIADLDFNESIQSILDSLALHRHQSIAMSRANEKEIENLQFRVDSLMDRFDALSAVNKLLSNYYLKMKNRIPGLSDTIKILMDMAYYNIDNNKDLKDSIAELSHKMNSIYDRLAFMSDSILDLRRDLYYNLDDYAYNFEDRSAKRDEYLLHMINMLFDMHSLDHNYGDGNYVKSFFIYDEWFDEDEYNPDWEEYWKEREGSDW